MLHKRLHKLISLLLATVMAVSMLPVFALNVGAAEGETWELVTDASDLAVGDEVIIVAAESDFAMSTNQKTSNRGQVAVTKGVSIVSFDSASDGDAEYDVQILTLKEGEKTGTFAFYTGSGYLYAASSSANNMKTQTTLNENGSWTISIAEGGVATIKAQGTNTRNWMRYNSSDSLFSCYEKGQKDIAIYKKTSEGTCAHVDSNNDGICETCNKCTGAHDWIGGTITTPATCLEKGKQQVICVKCEEPNGTEDIPALNHHYVNGVCDRVDCGVADPLHGITDFYLTYADSETKYELKAIADGESGTYQNNPSAVLFTAILTTVQDGENEYTAYRFKTPSGNYLGSKSGKTDLYEFAEEEPGISAENISWLVSGTIDNLKIQSAAELDRELRFNTGDAKKFGCYKPNTTYKQVQFVKPVVREDVEFVGWNLSLKGYVMLNITCYLSDAWIAANPGAKMVFMYGENVIQAYDAKSGENRYTLALPSRQLHMFFDVALVDANMQVIGSHIFYGLGVEAYATKINALESGTSLGISDTKLTQLKELLAVLDDYITAASEMGTIGVADNGLTIPDTIAGPVSTGVTGFFVEASAVLHEKSDIAILVDVTKLEGEITDYEFRIYKNGKVVRSKTKLVDYITADNAIVIAGIASFDYNAEWEIEIRSPNSDDPAATLAFTFNSYLKALHASTDHPQAAKNLAAVLYAYGVAAEAYFAPEVAS